MACVECPHCRLVSSIEAPTKPGGKAPYGFLATSEGLVFDATGTGPSLVAIMGWNAFEGCRPIAQGLNAQLIPGPAGGEWSHGSVARVIRQGKKYSHLIPLEYILGD